jgi:hypothetical protein
VSSTDGEGMCPRGRCFRNGCGFIADHSRNPLARTTRRQQEQERDKSTSSVVWLEHRRLGVERVGDGGGKWAGGQVSVAPPTLASPKMVSETSIRLCI